jgi:lipoprotein NlpI
MRPLRLLTLLLCAACCNVPIGSQSAEAATSDPLQDAAQLFNSGKRQEAFTLIDKAIKENPRSVQPLLFQGMLLLRSQDPAKAVDSFSKAIALDPKAAAAYQSRGEANFFLGRFKESVNDFDQALAIEPEKKPYHWQRGISCYYAQQYEEGRKQFEEHKTVNPNDVENAVWHYLCVAKISGVEKARSALIPMEGDARVPMKEIYALYSDKGSQEDVLKAASAGTPSPARLKDHLFYAHLYLGLYYEAQGDEKQARANILKAASEATPGNYMGDVAKVHARLFQAKRR